ncbi:hypothetical protein BG011_008102 [Mortierella polycephala]|uniref:Uncharacterized protein n=1 Tax=Mortierella polycephala TaxID=41804 RepID=A0A9P6TXI7_9FUNG|nr:hypothetical protein BG011_008102 [Mortierella polycephala]
MTRRYGRVGLRRQNQDLVRKGVDVPVVSDASGASTRFKGLTHSTNNVRNIFLATRFLVDNLHDIIYQQALTDDSISMTRDGATFRNLAIELETKEPSLRGVTGLALHALYDRIVEKYHEYQQCLKRATGNITAKTFLMDYSERLYTMDLDFLRLKQKKAELKDNEKKRLKEALTLRMMMEPLGSKTGPGRSSSTTSKAPTPTPTPSPDSTSTNAPISIPDTLPSTFTSAASTAEDLLTFLPPAPFPTAVSSNRGQGSKRSRGTYESSGESTESSGCYKARVREVASIETNTHISSIRAKVERAMEIHTRQIGQLNDKLDNKTSMMRALFTSLQELCNSV